MDGWERRGEQRRAGTCQGLLKGRGAVRREHGRGAGGRTSCHLVGCAHGAAGRHQGCVEVIVSSAYEVQVALLGHLSWWVGTDAAVACPQTSPSPKTVGPSSCLPCVGQAGRRSFLCTSCGAGIARARDLQPSWWRDRVLIRDCFCVMSKTSALKFLAAPHRILWRRLDRDSANSAEFGPSWTSAGPIVTNIGIIRSSLSRIRHMSPSVLGEFDEACADFGHICVIFDQSWADAGHTWAEIGKSRPMSAEIQIGFNSSTRATLEPDPGRGRNTGQDVARSVLL